jgi:hypothetical protein
VEKNTFRRLALVERNISTSPKMIPVSKNTSSFLLFYLARKNRYQPYMDLW